jgi:hypothetical protein
VADESGRRKTASLRGFIRVRRAGRKRARALVEAAVKRPLDAGDGVPRQNRDVEGTVALRLISGEIGRPASMKM